jgi:hypothetical protein
MKMALVIIWIDTVTDEEDIHKQNRSGDEHEIKSMEVTGFFDHSGGFLQTGR